MDITHTREYELDAGSVRITLMRGLTSLYHNRKFSSEISEAARDLFHTHSGFELFCAKNGPILLCFEDELYTLNPGHAAIVPPERCHYAIFSDPGDKKLAFNYMLFYLQNSDTARLLQKLHTQTDSRVFPMDSQAETLAQFLSEALNSSSASLCCTYMLALLLRLCQTGTPSDSPADISADNIAGRLYKIDQAIFSNHTGKLPLSSLAQELHLSPRQLSRIIQKHYGVSYRAKNKQLRMQSAARRLQKGEDIAQVAAAEGYHSLSAFYAAFRKTFGMTPAEFKRSETSDDK